MAEKCAELGAVAAGGADVVGRLEVGGFHWDEYDDLVAHTDFADSLNKIRKILRNRIPNVKNGEIYNCWRLSNSAKIILKNWQRADCVGINGRA